MQNLEAELTQVTLSGEKDKWSYTWGSTKFSSSRIYKESMDHPMVHPAFKWIWASPYQHKHKVFLASAQGQGKYQECLKKEEYCH
jgi:hypothetical protein